MIFEVFRVRKMIKEGKENPGKFASEGVGGLFLGIFFMPIISTLFFLSLFFVLGYTALLGGPFGFFKFLFVLFTICAISLFSILRRVYVALKQTTKHTVNETLKVESKIVE